jgi:hypothetical protein
MGKLLGLPFGIDLATGDVDQFLIDKIERKLHYWTTIRLSLAGRTVVVNMVLLSTLWFFIVLWGGTTKAIRQIKSSLMNFLWSGSSHRTRVRVSWTDCCAAKGKGGLGLIDPQEAMEALMAKWILKALQPGASHLQTFLRYRLQKLRPDIRGTWPQSIQWALTYKFSAPRGYRIWNRMIQGWKKFSKCLEMSPPTNDAEVLSTTLWWSTQFYAASFGFSVLQAARLMSRGLQHVRDLWNAETHTSEELINCYQVSRADQAPLIRMIAAIPQGWIRLLTVDKAITRAGEYLGIFQQAQDTHPRLICKFTNTFQPHLLEGMVELELAPAQACYSIGMQSKLLMQANVPDEPIRGFLKRVRIVAISRGQPRKLKVSLLYARIIQDMVFDLG